MQKIKIQKIFTRAILPLLAVGFLVTQIPAQSGLEGNQLRRNIDRTASELRQLISQENYNAAIQKSEELLALDPDNSAAVIWMDYAENKLSGPSESRLEKLLGVSINMDRAEIDNRQFGSGSGTSTGSSSNDIPQNNQSTEVASLPPQDPSVPTVEDDPFAQPADPVTDNPFNNQDQSVAAADDPFALDEQPDQEPVQPAETPAQTTDVPSTEQPTPAVATTQPPAPSSSSGGGVFGFSLIQIIIVVVLVVCGIGILAFLFLRKGKKDKSDSGQQTTQSSRSAVAGLETTGPLAPASKSDDGQADVSDAITQVPIGDKKTSGDMTTRSDQQTSLDQKTATDQQTEMDQQTASDGPTGSEKDLYDSLAADSGDSDSGLSFDDDDKETIPLDKEAVAEKERQKAAEKEADEAEGELSFSDVLFSEEDETKNTAVDNQQQEDEELDPNEMSFNSMMFGGDDANDATAETAVENPPKEPAKTGNEPTDVINLGDDDDEEEANEEDDKTFSSVMFGQDETVAPPGMEGSQEQAPNDEEKTDKGAESFSDVMFDPNQETVAPPGMGPTENVEDTDGVKNDKTEAETQVLPGMADTRPIPNDNDSKDESKDKKDDDNDDSIKL